MHLRRNPPDYPDDRPEAAAAGYVSHTEGMRSGAERDVVR